MSLKVKKYEFKRHNYEVNKKTVKKKKSQNYELMSLQFEIISLIVTIMR